MPKIIFRCQAFRPSAGYTRRFTFAVAVLIAGCNPGYQLQTLVPRGGFRGLWQAEGLYKMIYKSLSKRASPQGKQLAHRSMMLQ